MAKYDVYALADQPVFVVDVQADLLDELNTRIVVPLMELSKAPKPGRRLNPVFEIDGKQYVLVTQFMASIPRSQLKERRENLLRYSDSITNALDMAFQGF